MASRDWHAPAADGMVGTSAGWTNVTLRSRTDHKTMKHTPFDTPYLPYFCDVALYASRKCPDGFPPHWLPTDDAPARAYFGQTAAKDEWREERLKREDKQ